MNQWFLRTNGDWNETTLTNNGEEVPATELFLAINCGMDELGEAMYGGVACDGDLTAVCFLNQPGRPEVPIFPGRFELVTPGHNLVIENFNPYEPDVPNTVVWLDGRQVQLNLLNVQIHLDFDRNIIECGVALYKDNFFAGDEIYELSLL